jgi:hypothetical protein
VAQVDEDPQPVHLLHEFDAVVAEPRVAPLLAAVPRLVPVVVCELDDPYAPFPGRLEEADVPLQETAVLGAEDDGVLPLLLRLLDVRRLRGYEGLIVLLRPIVVFTQLSEGPVEAAPHADRGVARRQPPLEDVVDPDVLPHVLDEGDEARIDDDALPVEGESVLLLVLAQVKIALQINRIYNGLSPFMTCAPEPQNAYPSLRPPPKA